MLKDKSEKKYYHRKLVRDKIPEIIDALGGSYKARIVKITEHRKLLRRKLIEEAKELSDILQLVKSTAEFEGISFKAIEEKRKEQEKKRGAFKKRIFLIWSNKPAGGK